VAVAVLACSPSSARAATQGRLVKGPYLTGLSASGVDVRFELDGPVACTVEVRPEEDAKSASRVFASRETSPLRLVRVTGLEPGTAYAYRVELAGAPVGDGHFRTAPADDAGVSQTFLVYGDDRTDPAAHASVVQAMRQVPSDFLVNTGDLVEDGARSTDWQSFFDVEAPLLRDRPLFVSIGNHELKDDSAGANFARYVGLLDDAGVARPFGTVRLGRVRFFFMNGMHDWTTGADRDWLEHALTLADTEAGLGWRVAVVHHGPWSVGPHGPNAALVAAGVPRLLAAHNVDLVLSGHDHIYERGEAGRLKYMISGGGGAPLYPIEGTDPTERRAESAYHFVAITVTADEVRTVATRADGTVIERCGFQKGGPWDCEPSTLVASPAAEVAVPTMPPPASSHCGCALPGVRTTPDSMVEVAGSGLAGVLIRARRRRTSTRRRRARIQAEAAA
jgi:3',5'-cyclic AMP phosphodiesterase CpdA